MLAGQNDLLGRAPGERLWPEYFTEALEERLTGCSGGDERNRGALLPALTAGPRGLGKFVLAVFDEDAGYGAIPKLDCFMQLAA